MVSVRGAKLHRSNIAGFFVRVFPVLNDLAIGAEGLDVIQALRGGIIGVCGVGAVAVEDRPGFALGGVILVSGELNAVRPGDRVDY